MTRRAVVLAGGLGSRLRPYTTVIPKPLMPLGDRPILEILLRRLAAQGFERVDLCVGYLAHLIQAYFGDGASFGIPISYHVERDPLGTIGALALVPGVAPSEPILVMNGDILTDMDFGHVVDRHLDRGADATICVTRRTVDVDFGVIDITPDGRLGAYREKPSTEIHVSIGVNVVQGSAIANIAPGERVDAPTFMQRLSDAGGHVACHEFAGFWLDLGRIDDYVTANELVEAEPGRFLQT
jgi:NDP-mannose synthase